MPARVPASIAWQVIDNEAVLIDLARGRSLGFNAAGSFIWTLLAEGTGEQAIAERLCDRFEVDLQTARRHVDEFVLTLRTQGLLGGD